MTTWRSASTDPGDTSPLHNDLDAYALAFGLATLLNNVFGKGKEPCWQQAYTNLIKFIILLHLVVFDDRRVGYRTSDVFKPTIKAGRA
jgi:hypothetical protein